MRYFPIFVDLEGRSALIVGGGEPALQKTRLLLKTSSSITLVAAHFHSELEGLAAEGRIALVRRAFEDGDLDGKALVYAASHDRGINTRVASVARARGIAVNVVDDASLSTFITPALVDRDPVTIAIGTEGTSPVLAREIKTRLEAWLPEHYGRIASAAGALRERVASAIGDIGQRRRLWQRLLTGSFRRAALKGDADAMEASLSAELASTEDAAGAPGRILLIGCGPGASDLLTLRAQQALQEADVLVIDRLVPESILEHARREAVRVHVGKKPGGPSTSQGEINEIIVREALAGRTVARLKGGDPGIFGRAAEEMAAAEAAGIEVEVIPGISAALACAASIGLPLTARGEIREISLVAGATAEGEPDLDWRALAEPGRAFAVYMGVAGAPLIRSRLLAAGASPRTPVVIVENGTLASERAIATVLADLDASLASERVRGPAILFVGLDWARAGLERPTSVKELRNLRQREETRWSPHAVAAATHWVMG